MKSLFNNKIDSMDQVFVKYLNISIAEEDQI